MNIFILAGDMTHLISVLVLLLKIYAAKSCSDSYSNLHFHFQFLDQLLYICCSM
ncbi:hypothetical protein RDI58_004039 [Solanum bulbocastanum]|uniref:Uncharacterized protein n=1 Tax=Solanum bulbocastanum TaxID=147425 RepID=A0AAN8TX59_SOLBU